MRLLLPFMLFQPAVPDGHEPFDDLVRSGLRKLRVHLFAAANPLLQPTFSDLVVAGVQTAFPASAV